MPFKIGEKAVHKTHGVGVISGIETLNFGAGSQDYFLMKIFANGLTVRFPTTTGSQVVRSLLSDEEIGEVYNILKRPAKTVSMVWNRRKKEYLEKIRGGSIQEIAEVLRDLAGRSTDKDLSFGEKEMLEKARSRIVAEISAAKSEGEEEVGRQLDKILAH